MEKSWKPKISQKAVDISRSCCQIYAFLVHIKELSITLESMLSKHFHKMLEMQNLSREMMVMEKVMGKEFSMSVGTLKNFYCKRMELCYTYNHDLFEPTAIYFL